ncbi:Holocarboxylase synthetase [Zostera marina]|uniref:Holocarboxylase synthetase n=1 Tax=Zostera marina TaxID=29655 RepID=A0A0K9NSX2_ZOSMR|nr:Holocarboxylase synthetase [Zostera marina]
MGKRRRSAADFRLEEAERTMYTSFSSAANSLSHLYTDAMNQQKLSFVAGERNAMEKLHQWILRKHAEGPRPTIADVVSHLQKELNYGGEDSCTPRLHGNGQINEHSQEQTKNPVFLNALSSPDRRNLQSYQLAVGGSSNQSFQNSDLQNGDIHITGVADTSTDMQSDSPFRES